MIVYDVCDEQIYHSITLSYHQLAVRKGKIRPTVSRPWGIQTKSFFILHLRAKKSSVVLLVCCLTPSESSKSVRKRSYRCAYICTSSSRHSSVFMLLIWWVFLDVVLCLTSVDMRYETITR